MKEDAAYEKNNKAFRQIKPEIDAKYSNGQFVAIENGQVVADAPTYEELTKLLVATGRNRSDIFVARAGEDYPEYADILVR